MVIGLLAFLVGVIVGFVSLRALGWMCVIGVSVLLSTNGQADSMQFDYPATQTGPCAFPNNAYYINIWDSLGVLKYSASIAQCNGCGMYTASWSGGTPPYCVHVFGMKCNGGDIAFAADTAGNSSTCATHCGSHSGDVFHDTACDGGVPAPYYTTTGCITNASATMQGYYVHTSVPVQPCSGGTAAQDFYSGPLGPSQSWCLCLSNSAPFNYVVQQILYNNDGGTNAWTLTPPQWAGTNSMITRGDPLNGAPGNTGGNSPYSNPGGGAGNNTNLTGNQFNYGISNIGNIQINIGNQLAGGLGQLHTDLGQLHTDLTNQGSQIDYRSYLITLTNQGEGHLTMTKVLTNLAGQQYTQIVQIAALSATNFSWMTNIHGNNTNAWAQLTNGGGGLIDTNALGGAIQASNELMFASSGNAGTMIQATNITSGGYSSSILDLPIRTNVNSSGNWHFGFDTTAVMQQVSPWIRLLTDFIIFTFAVGYVHSRVQEECIRLGWIQGTNYNIGNAVSKVAWIGIKGAAKVAGLATLFGSLPPAIGLAVAYFVARYGGTPVSPLSDAGIAYAGTYTNAVYFGYKLLNYFVSFPYAITVLVYLFFFDMTITGTILFLQRLIKWTPQ